MDMDIRCDLAANHWVSQVVDVAQPTTFPFNRLTFPLYSLLHHHRRLRHYFSSLTRIRLRPPAYPFRGWVRRRLYARERNTLSRTRLAETRFQ
ncbi:hypothetical protein GOP47_0019903 [Adiantum capillus-veneris]|uniref:Uncharacterized protein n=1 Tax=Adiantum capillus-veneris TaxID=13818 RepID=A0A9D4UCX6_ADICA|nr:hypothetical protein GOP47_0019903 [Adiantum capillus-veneris]